MMMTASEKSPDNNQPPRQGRGRQPRCWARRQPRCWARGESGVSQGVGGGTTFARSPSDNQPWLGESAASPGEGESTTVDALILADDGIQCKGSGGGKNDDDGDRECDDQRTTTTTRKWWTKDFIHSLKRLRK